MITVRSVRQLVIEMQLYSPLPKAETQNVACARDVFKSGHYTMASCVTLSKDSLMPRNNATLRGQ